MRSVQITQYACVCMHACTVRSRYFSDSDRSYLYDVINRVSVCILKYEKMGVLYCVES